MKKVIIIIIAFIAVCSSKGQTIIERNIDCTGRESVDLGIEFADTIIIHTWKKKEVYTKASVDINHNQDNQVYQTSFEVDEKTVSVKATFEKDYFSEGKNNCIETMIVWEIFIPENISFSASTIDGNIIIEGKTKEIKAKSISGFIDWTIMSDCNADMELKTISGTFYTDLDISDSDSKNKIPQILTYKINNGGHIVKLETISGDIFCRKSK